MAEGDAGWGDAGWRDWPVDWEAIRANPTMTWSIWEPYETADANAKPATMPYDETGS